MLYYIKGTLEETGKDFIVVDNNGMAVKVYVPSSALMKMPGLGQPIKVYTHLHVREDALTLYGFLTKEEMDMFELLISVSGVGPKAALSVLSVMTPTKLGLSILGGDTKALTGVPGIGAKTAHRIILELKDKIDKDSFIDTDFDIEPVRIEDDSAKEAVNALLVLGYSLSEANSAVRKLETKGRSTEEIIKAALKDLMR